MKVQFLDPNFINKDIQEVTRVIKSGWLTYGKEAKKFEKRLAHYLGVKEAVLTSSGTASLHISLTLAGISKGDEVITTSLSYVSTSNSILYRNAKPVFVDVEPETGLIDVDRIEEKITKKTKAIIPVHLYGQMVDMKKLKKIADKYNLVIIEDAAHAIESVRDNIRPGQLSFSACFSFHASKNITSGEGGAIVTNSKKIAEDVELMCDDGVRKIKGKRRMEMLGYKYLTTDFQAAILNSQLKRIDEQWQKREKIFKRYIEGFSETEIHFPKLIPNAKHACHMFVVWVNPKKRDSIRKALSQKGIDTSIHYEAIHLEPYYRKRFHYKKGNFPIAEKLGASTISLPTYSRLSKQSQEYVVKTLKALV